MRRRTMVSIQAWFMACFLFCYQTDLRLMESLWHFRTLKLALFIWIYLHDLFFHPSQQIIHRQMPVVWIMRFFMAIFSFNFEKLNLQTNHLIRWDWLKEKGNSEDCLETMKVFLTAFLLAEHLRTMNYWQELDWVHRIVT